MIVSTTFFSALSKRVLGVSTLTLLVSAPLQAESIKAVLQAPLTPVDTAITVEKNGIAQLAAASVATEFFFAKPSERGMDEEIINQLQLRLSDEQDLRSREQASVDRSAFTRGVAAR